MSDAIEPEIEELARGLVKDGGADPDIMVQAGDPHIYGTPQGRAIMVMPGAAVPLWRMFIPAARKALALADSIRARRTPAPLAPLSLNILNAPAPASMPAQG
jgi:hypothetical protein